MRGFSLLEAMLVVTLAGVMAAIALPGISDAVLRERGRAEAVKVATTMEEARNRARIEVCKTVVDVDVTHSQITIGPDPNDTDAACAAMLTTVVPINPALATLAQFSIAGTVTNPLVFNASGGTGASARATMIVSLVEGATRTVEVWPATGAVRIK